MPALARAVCASPFDAAIHDAAGRAAGVLAFRMYDGDVAIPSADAHLTNAGGAARAISKLILRQPRTRMPAWLVVGAGDSIDADVRPWVVDRGYGCFKLKLLGRKDADVERTAEVFRAARQFSVARPRLVADSNEANRDASDVLDFLERLDATDPDAYAALEYLEQPTPRDVARHANDWRAVNARRPVLLDEGLTDLDGVAVAADQGWGGVCLKTCKGHSLSLVAAAWASHRGLMLTMQDLTNPGLAAIHSFLFAAHVPTANGVELNSPQYTPAANHEWLPRLARLFEPQDGTHAMEVGGVVGLGSDL